MTDTDEGGLPGVTPYDIERIQAQLRPGSTHSAAHLFTLYVRLMEADRRPIAHRTALGHALRRAEWEGKRVRRRVGGKQEEVASWVVPGAAPVSEDTERMGLVLAELGEGIHPEELIQDTYYRLAREHGWRWTPARSEINRWLTKNGYVRLRGQGEEKGKLCRYVWPRSPRP